jgi:hypothetical protein
MMSMVSLADQFATEDGVEEGRKGDQRQGNKKVKVLGHTAKTLIKNKRAGCWWLVPVILAT